MIISKIFTAYYLGKETFTIPICKAVKLKTTKGDLISPWLIFGTKKEAALALKAAKRVEPKKVVRGVKVLTCDIIVRIR